LAARILSLPLYAGITTEQVDRCVRALDEALDETSKEP
jgi:dTDP-4-amino-4,6-dideoxygalactose transaminase